jgi:hypothetical protein
LLCFFQSFHVRNNTLYKRQFVFHLVLFTSPHWQLENTLHPSHLVFKYPHICLVDSRSTHTTDCKISWNDRF